MVGMFYSALTNGFYHPDIHGENIPSDAKAISAEAYVALIAGQEAGKTIVAGEDGLPALLDAPPVPPPTPYLSRPDFVAALTQTTPPILTEEEAMAALEAFPPKFAAALADRPLAYRAAAIEAWRTTTTVARDAPLFLDLLALYAVQAGLNDAQAEALGDAIFAGAGA